MHTRPPALVQGSGVGGAETYTLAQSRDFIPAELILKLKGYDS